MVSEKSEHPILKRPFNHIELGIKKVGVGKKGSKEIDPETIAGIIEEIKNKKFNPISLGALFAGLFYKNLTEAEKNIFTAVGLATSDSLAQPAIQFEDLFNWLGSNLVNTSLQGQSSFNQNSFSVVSQLKESFGVITSGNYLKLEGAEALGNFLLGSFLLGNFLLDDSFLGDDELASGENAIFEFFRGFFISYLRVRYESRDEWLGLLKAIYSKIKKFDLKYDNFDVSSVGTKKRYLEKYLVFSEPFNGFNQQFFLSPILGNYFKHYFKQNPGVMPLRYVPFHLVGRNSGPKFKYNLYDLSKLLNVTFFNGDNPQRAESPWGYFLAQEDYAAVLDSWVERRWLTIKRPAWATLEKFTSPLPKDKTILITSAFHPPYLEKMVTLIEDFGFSAGVVSKLGLEGGLIPSLTKPFKLIATKKVGAGTQPTFVRKEFAFSLKDLKKGLKNKISLDKKFTISLAENAQLLNHYQEEKIIQDEEMQLRLEIAFLAYSEILGWINDS